MPTDTTIQTPNAKSVDSIIEESNFPKPNSKLQEIMARYEKAHPQSDPIPKQSSILQKVTVRNEAKKFDELKPEKQEKVVEIVKATDYMTSRAIQTFGDAKQAALTKNAETIISKYSAADFGTLADPITDLVSTIRSKNPKEITSKILSSSDKEGVFANFFSMKNAKKKLAKAIAEQQSLEKNFNAIEVELKNKQIGLMNDISIYEEMGKATFSQIADFELYSIALNLMIEDAQSKLETYQKKGELDLDEYQEVSNLEPAIERMKRKDRSLQAVRVSTIQTIPQLAVLIKGDEILCEKIDEISTLVIPMWKWQYSIAIGALHQKEVADIEKKVNETTSKLVKENAKLMHDNAIAIQEQLYTAAIAVEDLLTVQDYLDDMITQVSDISKKASQKYVEEMQTLRTIEERNYALLNKSIETD